MSAIDGVIYETRVERKAFPDSVDVRLDPATSREQIVVEFVWNVEGAIRTLRVPLTDEMLSRLKDKFNAL